MITKEKVVKFEAMYRKVIALTSLLLATVSWITYSHAEAIDGWFGAAGISDLLFAIYSTVFFSLPVLVVVKHVVIERVKRDYNL